MLGAGTVIPGVRVTVPAGWTSSENDSGEFNLHLPGHPGEGVDLWLNLVAVKSTGPGHGTTVLENVGRTPTALVHWLTTNPDFRILAPPVRTSFGNTAMTTLVVGVSSTARYGDPGCPGNPHCADLFTNPVYWGNNSYGIGGKEVVRLFLGRSSPGTIIVALDADNPVALKPLETAAKPILDSVRLPSSPSG